MKIGDLVLHEYTVGFHRSYKLALITRINWTDMWLEVMWSDDGKTSLFSNDYFVRNCKVIS